MEQLTYKITDALGLHARPAGLLVKCTSAFTSKVTIKTEQGKEADGKRLFAVMGLVAKGNDELTFAIDGKDEAAARDAINQFLKENL